MGFMTPSTPKMPKPPPPPPPPPEMPDPDDDLMQAQKRREAAMRRQSGRESTMLSGGAGALG